MPNKKILMVKNKFLC